MKVTVIGNGPSREPIPLDKISGITIGCNEIYQTFNPDYICAVDERAVKDLFHSDYTGVVYYNISLRGRVPVKSNWVCADFLKVHSSGNGAIVLANKHLKATSIDLLGFDVGPGRLLDKFEYKKDASFHLWEKNICFLAKRYKHITWRRVIDKNSRHIPEMSYITVEEYIKELDK